MRRKQRGIFELSFLKMPPLQIHNTKVNIKADLSCADDSFSWQLFLLGFVLFVFDSVRKAAAYPKGEIEKMLLIALKLL